MVNKKYDVAVIGAGPAGLIAAGTAASLGKKVILFEHSDRIARKLRITGKGRCNITNACDAENFFDNISCNSKFMYSSFYSFDNFSVMDFFESLGVPLKTERGGRVFPQSDKALDVVLALERFIKQHGVVLKFEDVTKVFCENGKAVGLATEKENYIAESIIVATGGRSYPLTGSTGDGYKFAQDSGHKITKIRPSLVPLVIKECDCTYMQGLSLKNVSLKLLDDNNKTVFSDFGEMLFTHFGVSGPIILSASAHIKENIKYKISVDLKPALSHDELDKRIQRDFTKYINKQFSNSLDDLLPKKMISVIINRSGIAPDKKVNNITKNERTILVEILKNFCLTVSGTRSIEEAIITSGGVDVNQINPSTMESKLVRGLYFCGEVIDVDAYTGGYNLQIAFSTGRLAGLSAGGDII